MRIDAGLLGKSVIVTGGSRGIGRAIVELFADEGCDVTFFYRDNAKAADEVVEAAYRASRTVAADQVDVRDAIACAAAVERVVDRYGRIDIMENHSRI